MDVQIHLFRGTVCGRTIRAQSTKVTGYGGHENVRALCALILRIQILLNVLVLNTKKGSEYAVEDLYISRKYVSSPLNGWSERVQKRKTTYYYVLRKALL